MSGHKSQESPTKVNNGDLHHHLPHHHPHHGEPLGEQASPSHLDRNQGKDLALMSMDQVIFFVGVKGKVNIRFYDPVIGLRT